MKDYERCTLLSVEYKNTSTVGNPSYWICFLDSEGHFHRAYTASNSSAGYTIKNYRYAENQVIYMTYHFTKNDACIVDCIKHNSPSEAQKEYLMEVEKTI